MPGRVGFILKGYPRLSEAFIAQEIRRLEARGLDIEIFSMCGPREELRHPVVAEIRAKVHYLPNWGPDFLLANLGALMQFPFAYLGALIHALARLRLGALARFAEAGWLVGRHGLGGRSPVSHLHAHFIHAPAELAFYAARISGLSFSVTAHAKDIYTSKPEDLALRIAAAKFVLTCTGYNRRHLAGIAGKAAAKIHLAYHGVDLDAFKGAQESQGDPRRFVSIGRLVAKKGFGQILSALSLLQQEGESFFWSVYGAGELEGELKSQAQRLGLSNRVRFFGHANHPEIIERLREGGIFLCGSLEAEDGDRDGIPNTLLEAMAMGLPIVATSVSAIPEAIRDGVDGLMVAQRDPAAICAAILRLLREPGLAPSLGSSARERVSELFDAAACIENCARHFANLDGTHEKDTVLLPALAGSRASH